MRGLEGKTTLVVAGGTSPGRPSIGGETARRLSVEGATVAVADIDVAAAERTVATIEDAGGTGRAYRCDVSDPEQVADLFRDIDRDLGALHGVHANAMDMSDATLGVDSVHDVCTLPLTVWQRTIDVGLTGYFLVCQHAVPRLVAAGGGGLVVTSSDAIYNGGSVRVAYAAAKTGVTAIVRHIATRYGHDGVRANAIAPGFVPDRATVDLVGEEVAAANLRAGRSVRHGTPADIAAAVTFLLSDDGSWVNGQTWSVDGGMILGR